MSAGLSRPDSPPAVRMSDASALRAPAGFRLFQALENAVFSLLRRRMERSAYYLTLPSIQIDPLHSFSSGTISATRPAKSKSGINDLGMDGCRKSLIANFSTI